MNILILFCSVVVGFVFWTLFAGKCEGDKLEKHSFRILINNYYIHIHHWLLALICLVILFICNIHLDFVYGLLIGSIIQGLTYKDWYIIIYRKDKFEEIYSRFK